MTFSSTSASKVLDGLRRVEFSDLNEMYALFMIKKKHENLVFFHSKVTSFVPELFNEIKEKDIF